MNKLLTIIFCTFIFVSCNKESGSVQEPEDVYTLKNISYFLKDGDSMKVDTTYIESKGVINKTSTDVKYAMNIPVLHETSQFINYNALTLTLKNSDSLKIHVPVLIDNGKIVVGQSKWKYNENGREDLPYSTPDAKENITVLAGTSFTVYTYAVKRNICTSYIATYEEQSTGKTLKIEGKWKGELIDHLYTIEEVKAIK